MAHDVFISYSHKDESIAQAVLSKLESAGIRCWIASRDIPAGTDWREAIVNAIQESQIMVLIFSSRSNASKDVKREVYCAIDNNVILIPLLTEKVKPDGGLIYYLAEVQWIEAGTPPLAAHLGRLLERVTTILPASAQEPESPQPQPKTEPAPPRATKDRPTTPEPKAPQSQKTVHVPRATEPITVKPKPEPFPPAITTQKHVRYLKGQNGHVNCVEITPDGKFAVSGSSDSILRLWDLDQGKVIGRLKGHAGPIECVAITPDGRYAISGAGDRSLKIWDLETGDLAGTLKQPSHVKSVKVSPNGRFAVSGSTDGTLRVWDLARHELVRSMKGHVNAVLYLWISPDGRSIISEARKPIAEDPIRKWESPKAEIKVWEFASGKEIRADREAHYFLQLILVTPDGRLAVSAGSSNLNVWELETGKVMRTLQLHTHFVREARTVQDGRIAISASIDRYIKIWKIETGQVLAEFELTEPLQSCAVSKDGKRCITAGGPCVAVIDLDAVLSG